jgi:hypothetical protein
MADDGPYTVSLRLAWGDVIIRHVAALDAYEALVSVESRLVDVPYLEAIVSDAGGCVVATYDARWEHE